MGRMYAAAIKAMHDTVDSALLDVPEGVREKIHNNIRQMRIEVSVFHATLSNLDSLVDVAMGFVEDSDLRNASLERIKKARLNVQSACPNLALSRKRPDDAAGAVQKMHQHPEALSRKRPADAAGAAQKKHQHRMIYNTANDVDGKKKAKQDKEKQYNDARYEKESAVRTEVKRLRTIANSGGVLPMPVSEDEKRAAKLLASKDRSNLARRQKPKVPKGEHLSEGDRVIVDTVNSMYSLPVPPSGGKYLGSIARKVIVGHAATYWIELDDKRALDIIREYNLNTSRHMCENVVYADHLMPCARNRLRKPVAPLPLMVVPPLPPMVMPLPSVGVLLNPVTGAPLSSVAHVLPSVGVLLKPVTGAPLSSMAHVLPPIAAAVTGMHSRY